MAKNPSKIYHDPRKNKILEIQKKIEDVKKQEKVKICVNLNQEITSKLNLPTKEQVFKNLHPIYEKSDNAQKILNETNRKIKETKNKDNIKEIDEMLKRLRALDERRGIIESTIKLTNEDKYYRFNRSMDYNQKPKAADKKFRQEIVKNCVVEISASDDFKYFVPAHKREPVRENHNCCCSCDCLKYRNNRSNHI